MVVHYKQILYTTPKEHIFNLISNGSAIPGKIESVYDCF